MFDMGCAQGKNFSEVDVTEEQPLTSQSHTFSRTRSETTSQSGTGGKYQTSLRSSEFIKEGFNPVTFQPQPFTELQKTMIRASWLSFNETPQVVKNATFAFVRLFVLSPESMEAFEFLKGISDVNERALLKSVVMKSHVTFLLAFIGEQMDHLDDMSVFHERCLQLGARHVNYGANILFAKGLCEGFLFALEKSFWPNVDLSLLAAWDLFLLHLSHGWALGLQIAKGDVEGV